MLLANMRRNLVVSFHMIKLLKDQHDLYAILRLLALIPFIILSRFACRNYHLTGAMIFGFLSKF